MDACIRVCGVHCTLRTHETYAWPSPALKGHACVRVRSCGASFAVRTVRYRGVCGCEVGKKRPVRALAGTQMRVQIAHSCMQTSAFGNVYTQTLCEEWRQHSIRLIQARL